jgi:23S rRNA G2445 N2-methylase RlmL
MKGIAITAIGTEDCASVELEEYGAKHLRLRKGAVIFEAKEMDGLAAIAYRCQSTDRILIHLADFDFENDSIEATLRKNIEKISIEKSLIQEGMTFRATCLRRGKHEFSRQAIEPILGDHISKTIKEKYDIEMDVNLASPDIIFYLSIVDNEAVLGIDIIGFEANKRDYKIFLTPTSIKGTIAFSLLKFAGYTGKQKLLDPFINDGAIIIEAALYASKKPVHFYNKEKFALRKLPPFKNVDLTKFFGKIDRKIKTEKLPITGFDAAFQYVDYGKKNAKIAGVEKLIYLSRVESEWLDIKFDKGTVDLIVTKIPEPSRKLIQKDVEKLHNELFYQAEYILKKSGKVAIICRELEPLRKHFEKFKFVVEKLQIIFAGEQQLVMALLKKAD